MKPHDRTGNDVIPPPPRHIHLMGICGTGMGAFAGLLKESGYQITGSDSQVYPPMSEFLKKMAIPVAEGYSPDNLDPEPDLVIVGNVIRRTNPEAVALLHSTIPYLSFPEALGRFFLTDKISLVITGTHGKTTTSSILASALYTAGLDPGFMIGGLVQEFGSNFRLGNGDFFVVEGDEYDTAFFDKGPKFLHYQPRYAVITSIEFDHADIYTDLEAIKNAFRRLLKIIPATGAIIACYDDPVVREIVSRAECPVITYGSTPDCDWWLENFTTSTSGSDFKVAHGQTSSVFSSPLHGRHNCLNCLAAAAVMAAAGVPLPAIQQGIKAFGGVKRRQEVRGEVNGITVIDDFAHHPTAVRETLRALRQAYDPRPLVGVFEPRTNSSRRKVFQADYVAAFDAADTICIREPAPLDIPEDQRFSCRQLVDDLVSRGKQARYFTDTDSLLAFLTADLQSGDVVVICSNGGFEAIHARLLANLQEKYPGTTLTAPNPVVSAKPR